MPMPDTVRELVAYAIIGLTVSTAAIAWLATRKRRRQMALRRRGIKSYD